MPETASVPLQPIVTGWLNHPWKSGPREALAVTLGGVASMRILPVTTVVIPSAFCAEHVRVVPAVSPGIVMAGKQLLEVEVASSDTDQ